MCVYPHTCLAHRILSRRAFCLRRAVLTRVVFHAFLAVVIVGVERAGGAFFAFGRTGVVHGCDEFLARSALCD